MIAIQTKFHGPTNYKGARLSAEPMTWSAGRKPRVTVNYDYAVSADTNHDNAARALISKLGWYGTWNSGSGPRGYVYTRQLQGQSLLFVVSHD